MFTFLASKVCAAASALTGLRGRYDISVFCLAEKTLCSPHGYTLPGLCFWRWRLSGCRRFGCRPTAAAQHWAAASDSASAITLSMVAVARQRHSGCPLGRQVAVKAPLAPAMSSNRNPCRGPIALPKPICRDANPWQATSRTNSPNSACRSAVSECMSAAFTRAEVSSAWIASGGIDSIQVKRHPRA